MAIFIEQLPQSPIGPLAIASTDLGVLAIEIGVRDLAGWGRGVSTGEGEVRMQTGPFPVAAQFEAYFAGERVDFALPLDLRSRTAFHRLVLEAVLAVPYGQTRTYASIAREIGRPGAARAVGRANATNPLPIVIPCHRLVGADGSLRGYGAPGGIDTKAWLLAFEASRGAAGRP